MMMFISLLTKLRLYYYSRDPMYQDEKSGQKKISSSIRRQQGCQSHNNGIIEQNNRLIYLSSGLRISSLNPYPYHQNIIDLGLVTHILGECLLQNVLLLEQRQLVDLQEQVLELLAHILLLVGSTFLIYEPV